MVKLGKMTDYGTVVMTTLAAEPARVQSAHDIAAHTGLSAPTVSKLLKLLARSQLVEAQRGASGGYRLARPATAISVADIVLALEGPIALTRCAEPAGDCSMQHHCTTSANWRLINQAIRQALEAVSLAQMTAPAGARRHYGEPTAEPLIFHRGGRDAARSPE